MNPWDIIFTTAFELATLGIQRVLFGGRAFVFGFELCRIGELAGNAGRLLLCILRALILLASSPLTAIQNSSQPNTANVENISEQFLMGLVDLGYCENNKYNS